jgi:hypothetical protein
MSEPYDFDRELAEVERFIAAVQTGEVGTSAAMAAYRDRHRPAIARLRAELASFRALLAEDDEARVQDAVASAEAGAGRAAVDHDAPTAGHPGGRGDPEDEG